MLSRRTETHLARDNGQDRAAGIRVSVDDQVGDIDAISGVHPPPRPVGRHKVQPKGFIGKKVDPVLRPFRLGERDGPAHAFLLADIVLGELEGIDAVGGEVGRAGRRRARRRDRAAFEREGGDRHYRRDAVARKLSLGIRAFARAQADPVHPVGAHHIELAACVAEINVVGAVRRG